MPEDHSGAKVFAQGPRVAVIWVSTRFLGPGIWKLWSNDMATTTNAATSYNCLDKDQNRVCDRLHIFQRQQVFFLWLEITVHTAFFEGFNKSRFLKSSTTWKNDWWVFDLQLTWNVLRRLDLHAGPYLALRTPRSFPLKFFFFIVVCKLNINYTETDGSMMI